MDRGCNQSDVIDPERSPSHRRKRGGDESDITAFLREFDIDTKVTRPREVLENLERWLTCFFPAQYETARESIKLIRAHAVSPRREGRS